MGDDLDKELLSLPTHLAQVLTCIGGCVREIAAILHNPELGESGTSNAFGDSQLQVDVQVDQLIFTRLAGCSAVEAASSEEQPEEQRLPGRGYTVAFDPLDGSSIVSANFAVGSIFGIWPGGSVVGQCGADQVAAAYAVYGPQTLLMLARPVSAECTKNVVQEFLLSQTGSWVLRRASIMVEPTRNVFAPANLRAAAENKEYSELVGRWIAANFTLRYTGGMVPDVHHILAKGGGIFCNPKSPSAPAKLRLVYECAPLSFIMEAAGGSSHSGEASILRLPISSTSQRTTISLGSSLLVEATVPALRA